MMILSVSADVADAIGAGAALTGWGLVVYIVTKAYGLTVTGILILWTLFKGESAKPLYWGGGIDIIPGLDLLPARTGGLLFILLPSLMPKEFGSIGRIAYKTVGKIKKIP